MPKYVHFSQLIMTLIDEGTLKPGDKLPSETDLAKALPVSLGTVQKALTLLAQRRIINRKPGYGTFVEGKPAILREHYVYRFLEPDQNTALRVYTRVTAIERIEAKGPWSDFLGADEFYIRIDRTIDIGGAFLVASRFYIRGPAFAPVLTVRHASLDGVHLGSFLRERFGTSTQRVVERLHCAPFPADICRTLGLPANQLGLVRHICALRDRNRPISFQNVYVPPTEQLLEIPTTR